jgi:hypothetical protein
MPAKTNEYWHKMFANLCIMISDEYLREKQQIRSLLWSLKAFFHAPYYVFVFKKNRVTGRLRVHARNGVAHIKRLIKSAFSRIAAWMV